MRCTSSADIDAARRCLVGQSLPFRTVTVGPAAEIVSALVWLARVGEYRLILPAPLAPASVPFAPAFDRRVALATLF